jgi:esterase
MTAFKQQQKQLLNYQQLGQGKPLLLIHGLFGSLENLNMVAKPLSEHYQVTSIDVRNHGDSFHQEDMAYSTLVQDVITLLDHLGIKRCAILGHSMGGKIAMQIALEYSERVEKLIIADIAPVNYPPHHLTIIKGLQAINFKLVTKRSDADKQLSAYVDNLGVRQFLLRNLSSDAQGLFHFKCSLLNISKGYQQLMLANKVPEGKGAYQGPTLFIKGGNSDYILAEHKAAITAFFPDSKAKVIQGTGHWLHAEKTLTFNKIVQDFLTKE